MRRLTARPARRTSASVCSFLFVMLVGLHLGGQGSLVGWPLFLLIVGGAGLAIGLRPRAPLPEPPTAPTIVPPPTIPLHRVDEG